MVRTTPRPGTVTSVPSKGRAACRWARRLAAAAGLVALCALPTTAADATPSQDGRTSAHALLHVSDYGDNRVVKVAGDGSDRSTHALLEAALPRSTGLGPVSPPPFRPHAGGVEDRPGQVEQADIVEAVRDLLMRPASHGDAARGRRATAFRHRAGGRVGRASPDPAMACMAHRALPPG